MTELKVNPTRISRRIAKLSEMTEKDRPWTRTAFSALHMTARDWLTREMQNAGLQTRIDSGGNLIGLLAGQGHGAPIIALGSHIDTVPEGGRFDGIAGVIAALETSQCLIENGHRLTHPIEIIDFLAEEPNKYGLSCVGSRAIAGEISQSTLAQTCSNGSTLAEGIRQMGGEPDLLGTPLREQRTTKAFLELHIEQGIVLQSARDDIGIVTDIAGISRIEISVDGRTDHSGTTPMFLRKDALVPACMVISAIEEKAQAETRASFVATVGKMDVIPNAANAVPGKVTFTLEVRAIRSEIIGEFLEWAKKTAQEISSKREVSVVFRRLTNGKPVAMSKKISAIFERAASQAGLKTKQLHSGAGHDAAFMARVAPASMIFIPCRDGRSHCPEEWSSEAQITKGAQTLLNAVLLLDETE